MFILVYTPVLICTVVVSDNSSGKAPILQVSVVLLTLRIRIGEWHDTCKGL